MATEFEELLLKVKADVNGAIADLKRFDRAVDETDRNVKDSTKATTANIDKTTASTKKLADESEKTEKKVKSEFEKMTGASDDAAKRFEANFAKSKTAGEAFDKTIRDLHARSKVLADLYSKTGDNKFFTRMKQAESDAKKLTSAAKDLGGALEKDVTKGASDAGGALSDLGPIIGGLAAVFSPLIGGALSGAILGGMGLGGIAAGIVGQLHSPQVEGSLAQFGADMKSQFTDATSAFAPVLESTLGALDKNLGPFWSSVKAGFTELAPYLKIVGDGFARFLNEFGPGIEAAFKGSEPVLTAIAAALPSLGQSLTFFFQQLEAGGTGAAESIGVIFQAIEEAIAGTGILLRGLSDAMSWVFNLMIKIVSGLGRLPGGEKFKMIADNMRKFRDEVTSAKPAMDGLQGSIDVTNDAIQKQTEEVNALNSAWSSATDAFLTYDNAQLKAIKESQAFSKALKDNGRDWDMTHTKGQANWEALLKNIQAQKDLYDSDVKIHGVTKDNTEAYQKAIDKLLAQAQAAGLSKDQIDKLRLQFENLGQTLDKLNGRKVTFTVQGNIAGVLPGGVRGSIASVLANSGVHHFANSGVAGAIPHFDLTGTYAGRPGGLYRFAEASTTEEALIARTGDSGRARATIREAAGWHGMTVVDNSVSSTYNHAAASYGGGGGDTMLYATIVMDSKVVARAIIPAVNRINGRAAVAVYG